MQVETLPRICPLCRRPAGGEALAPTRLCRDCRMMLAPIAPRAGFVQTEYAVTRAAAPALQATAVAPPIVPTVAEADFDEVTFAPIARRDEGFAVMDDQLDETVGGDFRPQPLAGAPVTADQPVSIPQAPPFAPEVFIAPDQYDDGDAFTDADQAASNAFDAPLNLPDLDLAPPAAGDVASVAEATNAPLAAEPHTGALPPALESHAAPAEAHSAAPVDLAAEPRAAAEVAAAADPWDDPLPVDEYSHREWPLLAKDERPSLVSRLKWPLVALLVIGVAAAAYFLFIKPRGQTPAAGTQEPLTVAPLPAAPPSGPATATSPAPASDQKETAKETPPASASPAIDSQSKYTLQVMASPNGAEANGMVERLKSAGLPAYVVRADLGSRGTWYRVRIGGFATHEEAQRFINEARRRAAAAGVPLKELQVTAYDKP